jgi:hypothetical protein
MLILFFNNLHFIYIYIFTKNGFLQLSYSIAMCPVRMFGRVIQRQEIGGNRSRGKGFIKAIGLTLALQSSRVWTD